MKNRTVEILAPAGSYESMVAAVNAGADAVYIGGSRFGARAYANNLDEETMVKAIDFMHIHGCRIYMTVNTLVKEKEMWDLYSYLKPYYEAGLDAVLVQDMGALTYIRKHFPDLPVHISTQMTVTGKYSARDLKSLGAVRVVPARELSLKEIREIYDDTGLEVETFVHGALCYCYSGQCLFKGPLHPGSDPGYPGSRSLFLKDRGTDEEPALYGRCREHLPEICGPLFKRGPRRVPCRPGGP